MEKQSQIPLLKPVNIIVSAGATRIISFPDEYLGRCVSIIITNLDSTNTSTYQINGDSSPILTLTTSGYRTIDATVIELLKIVAGGAGATQIEAQVQLLV